MKKIFEVALGVVTSVGGFLEIGSIATAAQAGSEFGFRLLWAILLGGLCVAFLVEMAGRFSAASHHTIVDAMRERFGLDFFVAPFAAIVVVSLLVLACEIGGACIAVELATGIPARVWAIPVAGLVWLLLWKGPFGLIEKGVSLLGLVTLAFVVAALKLHPSPGALAHGALPSLPPHDGARYAFIAVSILGASISPYLFYFYSSGAIEDRWDESDLGINRVVAGLGMGFGTLISIAVFVIAALVLLPMHVKIEKAQQLAQLLPPVLGPWGFPLFVASLFIACVGATLEIGLALAYFVAQGFGWNWGKNQKPRDAARFSLVYTGAIALAAVVMAAGVDPLQLTIVSMALTALTLPLAVFPFLLLMNDERYVGEHANGWIGNGVVVIITGLACVLAIVAVPLQIFGGG